MQGKTRSLTLLTALVITALMTGKMYAPALARDPAGRDLIRLHIVAHSDHPYDQALKLKVRDAVVAETGGLFQRVQTKEQAEKLLAEHLDVIRQISDRVLSEAGSIYRSRLEMGVYAFPEKSYEQLVLPAGRYQALRIVLGGGKGGNWWCVLFPPLCFVDGSSGSKGVPVNAAPGDEQGAKQVLASGSGQKEESAQSADIEVRFKLVELWEKVRPQARALLSLK